MEVESCNNIRLAALEGPGYTYTAMDSAGYDVYHQPITDGAAEVLLNRLVSVSKITLKVRSSFSFSLCLTSTATFVPDRSSGHANTGTR
jgi:hypothetical protein